MRLKKRLEERIADLKAAGADIRAYSMDVLSRKAVFDAIAAILSDFGKIDIMINNAGVWNHRDVIGRQRFEEMDPAEWKRLLEIDLDGVFHCCQAILPHMIERGYGRIINTTSIAGEVGLPGYADYAAAKAGLIMFTKTLAMENAKKGITMSYINIGGGNDEDMLALLEAAGSPAENYHRFALDEVDLVPTEMREELMVPEIKDVNYEAFRPKINSYIG